MWGSGPQLGPDSKSPWRKISAAGHRPQLSQRHACEDQRIRIWPSTPAPFAGKKHESEPSRSWNPPRLNQIGKCSRYRTGRLATMSAMNASASCQRLRRSDFSAKTTPVARSSGSTGVSFSSVLVVPYLSIRFSDRTAPFAGKDLLRLGSHDSSVRNVPTRRSCSENVAALICAVLHDPIGDSPAIL
jgi:hypothetical protein